MKKDDLLSQPLTLGLLRKICFELLADSAPPTKLVATAVIRNIDALCRAERRKKKGKR